MSPANDRQGRFFPHLYEFFNALTMSMRNFCFLLELPLYACQCYTAKYDS
jgi:hypothetical protein